MYWSCSIMQSIYPSLIHPTAIILSGAHLNVPLGARLFMEMAILVTEYENLDVLLPEGLHSCCKVVRW